MDDPEQEIFCGHTLMATCPPPTYCENHPPGQLYPLQTYDVPRSSLNRLLNLSRQLVTEGQITPIMAVQSIKSHTSYAALTANDIRHIMDELINKIRCYGFGAVVEDFEFMDAMTSVLSNKHEGAGVLSGLRGTDPSMGERAADRYKRMFGYKLASLQADGKYIGGGGVAGPGMPQVDEFLYA
ncbi:hypothetical protein KEM55_005859 [Ascosphaera atra]|nr:hypothetical protein KEM55_005859 [Ascosphaera atra]